MNVRATADDFIQICDLVYTYATAIDAKDWKLYRSIFADEIDMDFSAIGSTPLIRISADEWVGNGRPAFVGLDATQHFMSNPRVTVDGDTADCTVYLNAEHFLVEDDVQRDFSVGASYDVGLIRSEGSWKISAMTIKIMWSKGDLGGIMQRAVERAAERTAERS